MEYPVTVTLDALLPVKEKVDKTDQSAPKRSQFSYVRLRQLPDDAIIRISKWLTLKVDELYSNMVDSQVSL